MRMTLGFAAAAAGLVLLGAAPASAVQISISCGAVGNALELCKEGAEAWARQSGNTVQVISTPNSTTERLALYQQQLAAGSSDIDVYQIDVIWPGTLKSHFLDLKPYSKGAEASHFQSIVDNNTVDGKLLAMPWYTDVGLLFYRKDLLAKYGAKPPETWAELADTAAKIQDGERKAGNDKLWGFVWQGRAYEGLTCDAVEWIDSYKGTLFDAAGHVAVNSPANTEALKTAAGWIGSISPQGVLNYQEEDARGVFQSGNAVFMRNWPYVWALANSSDSPVNGKVGIIALPKGGLDGRHSATLGGWQLAIAKYSKHPEIAADLVMYLVSQAEQKRRAISGAYNPTIPALYQDAEVLRANPFFADLGPILAGAVARPSRLVGANYPKVSNEVWDAVHAVLAKTATPEQALADLDRSLKRALR
ncbi:carbohydrate ABC transporter substrate-binding protein, CUT1 family [Rhizobiales bacterium GAS113]|nr:carbohydrate ABC transporter substrate-binding protein, CUT1 family [Rhizobiales bacterium GAS113]